MEIRTHMFHTGENLGFNLHVLILGASLGSQGLQIRVHMFHIETEIENFG